MGNIISLLIASLWLLSAPANIPPFVQHDIPVVFQLRESDEFADRLQTEFSASLLKACRNDAQIAFQYWRPLTKEIERLAREAGLCAPGTKLWIKAFWNKDGRLVHIGYESKSDDMQLNHDRWQNLFQNLIREYDMEGRWQSGFYHLGSICMR